MNYKLDDFLEYCAQHEWEPVYMEGKIVYIDRLDIETHPYLILVDIRGLDEKVLEYIEAAGYKVNQKEMEEWINKSKYNKYLKKYEDDHYRLVWAERFNVTLREPLFTLDIILRTLENEVPI